MKLHNILVNLIIFSFCPLMNGCAHPIEHTESSQAQNTQPHPTDVGSAIIKNVRISHLEQCNRDLESLRTVSPAEYRAYLAQYDTLMKNSADFMAVKDDVSPEVTELARPKFQFALVNLCYRIKNALAQTLINQAGGTH